MNERNEVEQGGQDGDEVGHEVPEEGGAVVVGQHGDAQHRDRRDERRCHRESHCDLTTSEDFRTNFCLSFQVGM